VCPAADAAAVWLSITVDGDAFDETDKPALRPLTDWHVVVAPPLVIENTLPIAGHYIVWERPQVPPPAHARRCALGSITPHAISHAPLVTAVPYPCVQCVVPLHQQYLRPEVVEGCSL